jgi:hypothetical protein
VEARKEKKTHVAPVFLIGASCLSFEARCVSGKLKLDGVLDGVAPSLLSTVTVVASQTRFVRQSPQRNTHRNPEPKVRPFRVTPPPPRGFFIHHGP